MTTLAFPTLSCIGPGEIEWALIANTQRFSSPLTQSVQTVEMPGARWRASFTLRNLQEADAALMQAFMARLRGSAGRFTLHNFARPQPRGTLTGTPLVKGAAQTGTTLLIDGCTVGATLKAGDYFGVNGELKMVVADATADGAGEMTLTFEPPLRASPADNAALTLVKPTATFMLEDDAMRWLTRAPLFTDVAITCVEAF